MDKGATMYTIPDQMTVLIRLRDATAFDYEVVEYKFRYDSQTRFFFKFAATI